MGKNILEIFSFSRMLEDIFTNEEIRKEYEEFIKERKNAIPLEPKDISEILKVLKNKESAEKIFNLVIFLGKLWGLQEIFFEDGELTLKKFAISLERNRASFY